MDLTYFLAGTINQKFQFQAIMIQQVLSFLQQMIVGTSLVTI